jgi:hypothetical protein
MGLFTFLVRLTVDHLMGDWVVEPSFEPRLKEALRSLLKLKNPPGLIITDELLDDLLSEAIIRARDPDTFARPRMGDVHRNMQEISATIDRQYRRRDVSDERLKAILLRHGIAW